MSETPGLKTRINKHGARTGYWIAANCSRKAKGFPNPVIRLGGPQETWPTQCQAHKADLLLWIAEQQAPVAPLRFDGTFASLIDQYTRHPLSTYHKVKETTRKSYDWTHKVLRKAVGARLLAKVTGVDFLRWAEQFAKPAAGHARARVARSHDLMSAVRRIIGWGVVLELPHCRRLQEILQTMEFEGVAARTAVMTFDMCQAIIAAAHQADRGSIALAQALQFELALRQIDVIGEWVTDMTGDGVRNRSRNTRVPKRWQGGVTWGHIDGEMVLRKLISKTARRTRVMGEYNLKEFPLVMAQIARVPLDKRIGPLVLNEETNLPYTGSVFRNRWREAANAAGIPAEVQNRDSRAGGVTETTDAGATLEMARTLATHKNLSTTARYSRATVTKNSEVARLRSLHRQKNVGTKSP